MVKSMLLQSCLPEVKEFVGTRKSAEKARVFHYKKKALALLTTNAASKSSLSV